MHVSSFNQQDHPASRVSPCCLTLAVNTDAPHTALRARGVSPLNSNVRRQLQVYHAFS